MPVAELDGGRFKGFLGQIQKFQDEIFKVSGAQSLGLGADDTRVGESLKGKSGGAYDQYGDRILLVAEVTLEDNHNAHLLGERSRNPDRRLVELTWLSSEDWLPIIGRATAETLRIAAERGISLPSQVNFELALGDYEIHTPIAPTDFPKEWVNRKPTAEGETDPTFTLNLTRLLGQLMRENGVSAQQYGVIHTQDDELRGKVIEQIIELMTNELIDRQQPNIERDGNGDGDADSTQEYRLEHRLNGDYSSSNSTLIAISFNLLHSARIYKDYHKQQN